MPGRPFCLSLSFWAPHAEDDAPEQYFWPADLDGLYADVTLQPPPTSEPAFFAALPEFLRQTLNRERWHWRFDTPAKYQLYDLEGDFWETRNLVAGAGQRQRLEGLRRRADEWIRRLSVAGKGAGR